MAVTNGYCTLAELKTYLLPSGYTPDTTDDTVLEFAINSASRWIDGYCGRRFWIDTTASAQTFVPDSLTLLCLDDDIADSASVIVKTDAGGDGTFETTWAATDFQLLPQNAPHSWPEAKPWTAIRAVGTRTFPWLVNTWLTRLDRVQVTAKWGWPAVPDAVKQACFVKAAKLYKRRDTVQGVIADAGMYLGSKEDPDVIRLLQPYRKTPVLVG